MNITNKLQYELISVVTICNRIYVIYIYIYVIIANNGEHRRIIFLLYFLYFKKSIAFIKYNFNFSKIFCFNFLYFLFFVLKFNLLFFIDKIARTQCAKSEDLQSTVGWNNFQVIHIFKLSEWNREIKRLFNYIYVANFRWIMQKMANILKVKIKCLCSRSKILKSKFFP